MPEKDEIDTLLCKIALSLQYLNTEQLTKCIIIQGKSSPRKALSTIMVDEGYITEEQLEDVLRIQNESLSTTTRHPKQKLEDIIAGKLAVKYGFATESDVKEALNLQKQREAEGSFYRLGEILVEKGNASAEDVMTLLSMSKGLILICPSCGAKFDSAELEPGKRYSCKRCKALLPVTEPIEAIDFGSTVVDAEAAEEKPTSPRPEKEPEDESDITSLPL